MSDSWLRNHFHEFVFPAFMASEKRSSEIGDSFHIKAANSAPEELPTELKKLWTLCKETQTPWVYDVRERNIHNGNSKYRESARLHHNIINDTLDSSLAALRDEKCSKLFLGGRDVWTYAVMCNRRRIPNLYAPELSRTVSASSALKTFLDSIGFTGDELFLDTGYVGSIPKRAGEVLGKQIKFRLVSQTDLVVKGSDTPSPFHKPSYAICNCKDSDEKCSTCVLRVGIQSRHYKILARPNQLRPNRDKARVEALETEYLAKYWKSGTVETIIERRIWNAQEAFKAFFGKDLCRINSSVNSSKFSNYFTAANMAIYHNNKIALVSISDAKKLAPGFYEWYLTLPELDFKTELDRVVQYFSDKQTIQRAALLTSMLWRGIPYWKTAMKSEKQSLDKKNYSLGTMSSMTGITNAITGNAVSMNMNFIPNTGGIVTYNILNGGTANTVAAVPSIHPALMQVSAGTAALMQTVPGPLPPKSSPPIKPMPIIMLGPKNAFN